MATLLAEHSVSTTKENLSALLAEVESSGIPFAISRYGKPVAIVTSYEPKLKSQPKLKGSLNSYANPGLQNKEKDAWKKAVTEK